MAMHTIAITKPPCSKIYFTTSTLMYGTSNGSAMGIAWDRYMSSFVIKFETPNFVGSSEYLTLRLSLKFCEKDFVVRCALCDSDENWKKYRTDKPSSNFQVSDEHQIALGSEFCPSHSVNDPYNNAGVYKDWEITLPVRTLKPNTTYYLFLWGCPDNPTTSQWGDQASFWYRTNEDTIIIGYNDGLVHIDTGTVFASYQCYIDNGSSWDLVIPYIDNGSDWDMYT